MKNRILTSLIILVVISALGTQHIQAKNNPESAKWLEELRTTNLFKQNKTLNRLALKEITEEFRENKKYDDVQKVYIEVLNNIDKYLRYSDETKVEISKEDYHTMIDAFNAIMKRRRLRRKYQNYKLKHSQFPIKKIPEMLNNILKKIEKEGKPGTKAKKEPQTQEIIVIEKCSTCYPRYKNLRRRNRCQKNWRRNKRYNKRYKRFRNPNMQQRCISREAEMYQSR